MTCSCCKKRNQDDSLYCDRCGKALFKSILKIGDARIGNKAVHLFPRDYTIGRAPDNDIPILDPSVSRRHVVILHENDGFVARNASSKNGSLLNNEPLTRAILKNGDFIQLGSVELHYYSEENAPELANGKEETAFYRQQFLQLFDDTRTVLSDRDAVLDVLALTMSISDASHVQLFAMDSDGTAQFRLSKKQDEPRSNIQTVDTTARTLFQQAIETKCPQLMTAAGVFLSNTERDYLIQDWSRMVVPLLLTHQNGTIQQQVIGLCYFMRSSKGQLVSVNKQQMFSKFIQQLAMAMENERLYHASKEQKMMLEELQRAGHVQRKLRGCEENRVQGFDIEALVKPNRGISGDYFDVIQLAGNKVLFTIGDICGSGVPAALVSSTVQATVRSQMRYSTSPRRLLNHLNLLLRQSTNASTFVTLFVGILDPTTNELSYLNAGHPPPLLISGDKKVQELKSTNPPLGVIKQTYSAESVVAFGEVSMLVMYTDGLLECQNQDKERLGRNRLRTLVKKQAKGLEQSDEKRALRMLTGIETDMTNFAQGTAPTDDLTLIVAARRSVTPEAIKIP